VAATNAHVQIVDQNDGIRILDEEARRYLHISAAEFIRRWDAGDYAADADRPEVMRVAMLLPFAR